MKFNHQYTRSHQDGFTLVEIMIGLVIGMLATLVIVQVMSVFETQKRSTTGTADAQTSGGIALYNVGRELKLAGYPLMPTGFPSVADSPLECTSLNGAADTTNITPVLITNGVAAAGVSASDTITIRYGNSLTGGIPRTIGAAPVGRAISVGNNFGCQNDDVVMITNGAACAMTRLAPETETPAAVTGTTTVNLMSTEIVPAAAVAGADLSCIGTWNTITYAVVNGNLQRNGADSVAGIVNIQAQYGISTTVNDNQINAWVDATGIWAPTALALTPATRNRIKAIRIAVVARNAKSELVDVSSACSSITAAAPTGVCAWTGVPVGGTIATASPAPTLSLVEGDANWARYRYRVYETIIPLRNMIWSRETL